MSITHPQSNSQCTPTLLLDEGYQKRADPKEAHGEFIGNSLQGSTYTLPAGGVFEGDGDSQWPGFCSLIWALLDPIELWY